MSALTLAMAWSIWTAMADGPQTTEPRVDTTTRDPTSKPVCGCSTSSFILAMAESKDSPLVRQNHSSFKGPNTVTDNIVITSATSQEACEATLLTTSAVAYSYNILTQSCELFTKITESISAPNVHSGATMQEFPMQCYLACIAYEDPRWTGVVRTNLPPVHRASCQCCFNEDSSSSGSDLLYYLCSASGCETCGGTGVGTWSSSDSVSKTTGCRRTFVAATAFLFTSLGL